jgi:adenylyltransferase/sulfurtransferase
MQQINLQQLQELLNSHQPPQLIDVREPYEHEAYNIGGTLIPLADIIKSAAAIPTDKPVVIYCRKGIRSQIAIQRLEAKFGYNNLINLQGGVEK